MQTVPPPTAVDPDRLDRSRDLLVIYTLCYGARLQLYAQREQPLNVETSQSIRAATAIAEVLHTIDVARLRFVDPILGVSLMSIQRSSR